MSSCEPYRDALSALLDGEAAPLPETEVRAHVDGCAACTGFVAASEGLSRRVRVAEAEPVPDLTASILAAVSPPDVARTRARFEQLRALLVLVGVVQLVLAVPVLFAAGGLPGHVAREAGIFELALGIGFLVVAWRPSRAGGLLPVAAVVSVLLAVTSVSDLVAGTAAWLPETAHVLELVGTGLLWALDRRQGSRRLDPATA
jgi:predicted anti-sigma-YlaC factor YlaD